MKKFIIRLAVLLVCMVGFYYLVLPHIQQEAHWLQAIIGVGSGIIFYQIGDWIAEMLD